jgi:arginine:ornithine antiporter/lysine permease
MQLLFVAIHFSGGTYQALYTIVASAFIIPYVFSVLYALKIAKNGENYASNKIARIKDIVIALIAMIYLIYLLFNTRLSHMFLSVLAYAVGVVIYMGVKSEKLSPNERIMATLLLILSVVAIVLLSLKKIPF